MRLRSLLGSAVGIVIAVALWQGLGRIIPVGVAAGMPQRLGMACAALLPTVCVLDLMIVVQMALRVRTGAVDPLAGRDNHTLQVNQRALTNTVEQLAGFVPALLALAAGAPPAWLPFVVAAGLAFGLARLVFWAGYLIAPLWRGPGMAASLFASLATLAGAVAVWL